MSTDGLQKNQVTNSDLPDSNNRQCAIQRLGLGSQLRCSSIGFVHGDLGHVLFSQTYNQGTEALVTGAGIAVLLKGTV